MTDESAAEAMLYKLKIKKLITLLLEAEALLWDTDHGDKGLSEITEELQAELGDEK